MRNELERSKMRVVLTTGGYWRSNSRSHQPLVLTVTPPYIYIYITVYFKYLAKTKGSELNQVVVSFSSNNHIFVLNHSLQLKLSATDSSVSLLSFNMRFCMDIFNLQRVIHLYIAIGSTVEVSMGWLYI